MQVAVELHSKGIPILFCGFQRSGRQSGTTTTATPFIGGFPDAGLRHGGALCKTMQAASARVATATVFIFPITVTQAQSAGPGP